jgi:hypothetical protein
VRQYGLPRVHQHQNGRLRARIPIPAQQKPQRRSVR